ncbi:MAG: trypsin-like serine protease [Elusimicrobiales bacterium]|nr:trypsin-like serine protease [Elusimicrobiales bacterium]
MTREKVSGRDTPCRMSCAKKEAQKGVVMNKQWAGILAGAVIALFVFFATKQKSTVRPLALRDAVSDNTALEQLSKSDYVRGVKPSDVDLTHGKTENQQIPAQVAASFTAVDIPDTKGIFAGTTRELAYGDPLYDSVHVMIHDTGWCTAFMIGDKWAITAAHCIVKKNPLGIKIDRIKTFRERLPIKQVFVSSNYEAVSPFVKRGDFALLELHTKAPEDIPFSVLADSEEISVGMKAITIGYPAHAYNGRYRVVGEECSVRKIVEDSIYTDCPLSRGNSGGPLFVLTASGWKVAGVVSTQYIKENGTMVLDAPYSHKTANHATNITLYSKKIFRTMEAVAGEND